MSADKNLPVSDGAAAGHLRAPAARHGVRPNIDTYTYINVNIYTYTYTYVYLYARE